MNQKKTLKQWLLFFLALASLPVFAVQDVYEYKGKEGVVEFTDQVNEHKTLEKHIQIPKMTEEETAESKAKLDAIMEKDKELDKKLEKQRMLENERLQRNQESTIEDSKDENGGRRRGYYRRYIPMRPVHPIERPKPKPKPKASVQPPKMR